MLVKARQTGAGRFAKKQSFQFRKSQTMAHFDTSVNSAQRFDFGLRLYLALDKSVTICGIVFEFLS